MPATLLFSDVHLSPARPAIRDILIGLLHGDARRAAAVYILGDLFNVWFAEPKFRMPHQERVLGELGSLAAAGVVVKFVEGNRDYSVRRNCLGRPFAEVSSTRLTEVYGSRRVVSEHGDEINRADRQYRMWKRFSRSFAVYGLFRLLPGRRGIGIGESLERTLSGTNMRNKSYFPAELCRAYAEDLFRQGGDALILGHFHEERILPVAGGTVYVMPTWRGHHRYLCFEGEAPPRFVQFVA